LIKADLHIHTCYSHDCCTSLEQIVNRCLEVGLDCIAITDHNTIAGALELERIAPFRVIVGAEVLTALGELMGLFLREEVPQGLSPLETAARIKQQGGLVGIPHPFGRWPLQNSHRLLSPDLLEQVDFIEVFNSRSPFSGASDKARALALKYDKQSSAGSDAHTVGEIGRAYVEMPEFESAEDFLQSLSRSSVFGEKSSNLVHFFTMLARVRKLFC
jgi:hypothetical protein